MATLLITGAAGRIGTALRPRLLAAGHSLVLFDAREPDPPVQDGERFVPGQLDDRAALETAVIGVDTVVHLAGIPTENTWEALVSANITGTKDVLEVAADNGVLRVLLASSVHAVGFVPEDHDAPGSVPGDLPPRPDSYYGVSKAVMELLGSLFVDRFAMSIVSARIAAFGADEPGSRRARWLWTSADDLARLVEVTVGLTEPGHHVLWATSRNSGSPVDLAAGERIGFHPEDDAAEVLTDEEFAAMPDEEMRWLGGSTATVPLGEPAP